MKYYLVEMRRGDEFATEIDAQTQENAVQKAETIWEKLSDHDRKITDYAYVCAAEPADAGTLDPDTLHKLKDLLAWEQWKKQKEDIIDQTVDFLMDLIGEAQPEKAAEIEQNLDLYANDYIMSTFAGLTPEQSTEAINEAVQAYQSY